MASSNNREVATKESSTPIIIDGDESSAAKAAQREHKRRQAARKKDAECDRLLQLFDSVPAPGGRNVESREWTQLQTNESTTTSTCSTSAVDWVTLPPSVTPALGGSKKAAKAQRRLVRKRVEVESFAAVLFPLLREILLKQRSASSNDDGADTRRRRRPIRVVDFASGSGALVLPLAAIWRSQNQQQQTKTSSTTTLVAANSNSQTMTVEDVEFIGVDMKPTCVKLLNERAADAGLGSVVRGHCSMIEEFMGVADDGTILTTQQQPPTTTSSSTPMASNVSTRAVDSGVDIVLGLHACGNATDCIMEQAILMSCAYLVSPCCIGKLRFSMQGGTSFSSGQRSWAAGGDNNNNNNSHLNKDNVATTVQVPSTMQSSLGTAGISHPRSKWLRESVAAFCASPPTKSTDDAATEAAMDAACRSPELLVSALVRLADISEVDEGGDATQIKNTESRSGVEEVAEEGTGNATTTTRGKPSAPPVHYPQRVLAARLAKLHVEMDRSMRMRECHFITRNFKLLGHERSPAAKSDLLLGIPSDVSWASEFVTRMVDSHGSQSRSSEDEKSGPSKRNRGVQ